MSHDSKARSTTMDVSSFALFFLFLWRLLEEDRTRQCQRHRRLMQCSEKAISAKTKTFVSDCSRDGQKTISDYLLHKKQIRAVTKVPDSSFYSPE